MDNDKPKMYDKLPLELAQNIWKLAFDDISHGVHHFRLKVDTKIFPHRLIVSPWEKNGKSPVASTWRQRLNMSVSDRVSKEVYKRWVAEMDADGAFWVAPLPVTRTQPQTADFASRAKVHIKNDLVVFTFTGNYLNIALQDRTAAREQFKGLRNVGFNWKQTNTGHSWGLSPFQCACANLHPPECPCPLSITRIVQIFPDVQDVYFIYRLTVKDLEVMALRLANKRALRELLGFETTTQRVGRAQGTKTKVPRMSANQLIEESLAEFQRMAERRGGKIWNDGERTFIEVHRFDLRFLFCEETSDFSATSNWQSWSSLLTCRMILRICKDNCERNNALNALLNRPIEASPNFHFMVCRQQIVRRATKSQASHDE
ncbi:hypothetical protein E8E14_012486 [Neopestalotiopsis sp. 37M]|nr:hypothetical protein E8E14_012486 [Neopestalotiopsis sp. 37M]